MATRKKAAPVPTEKARTIARCEIVQNGAESGQIYGRLSTVLKIMASINHYHADLRITALSYNVDDDTRKEEVADAKAWLEARGIPLEGF